MLKTIDAIFENGVLKPVAPLNIPEHKKITLVIDEETGKMFDILSLASLVYDGLAPSDIEAVEEIAIDRSRFSRD